MLAKRALAQGVNPYDPAGSGAPVRGWPGPLEDHWRRSYRDRCATENYGNQTVDVSLVVACRAGGGRGVGTRMPSSTAVPLAEPQPRRPGPDLTTGSVETVDVAVDLGGPRRTCCPVGLPILDRAGISIGHRPIWRSHPSTCTQTTKLTDHAGARRVAGVSPHSGGGQWRPGKLLALSRCRPCPSRRFRAGRPRASRNPRRQRRRESRDGRNRLLSHRRVSVLSHAIRSEFTRPVR